MQNTAPIRSNLNHLKYIHPQIFFDRVERTAVMSRRSLMGCGAIIFSESQGVVDRSDGRFNDLILSLIHI